MPSNAKRRRQSQLAEEERQQRISEARPKLFGLMLVAIICIGVAFFLPPTVPFVVIILAYGGAIASLIAAYVVAQPILRELQGGPQR